MSADGGYDRATSVHGGVCLRTSTPRKSGTKMKENKKVLKGHCIEFGVV